MSTNILQKSYDSFIMSSSLILQTIVLHVKEELDVKKNALVFLEAINKKQLEVSKVGDIIKKVFMIVSNNINYLKNKDVRLFDIKEKRNGIDVTVTLLPGINLYEAFLNLEKPKRKKMWKYVKGIYIASLDMISFIQNGNIDENIKIITDNFKSEVSETYIKQEYDTIFKNKDKNDLKKEEFNVFTGVGENNNNYSVEEMNSGPELLPDQQAPPDSGIGLILEATGLNKMINLDDLAEQLKNITPEEIKEATDSIKKLLGKNLDEKTAQVIDDMINDVTQELTENKKENLKDGKGGLSTIGKIAETVAKKVMPKINSKNLDPQKIIESTQNLTNIYKDQMSKSGNNGPDPMAMLSSFLGNQMKMAENLKNNNGNKNAKIKEDMMKQYKNMMKDMNVPQDLNNLFSNLGKGSKKM